MDINVKKLSNQRIGSILRRIRNEDKLLLKKLLKRVIVLEDKDCWSISEDWSVYTSFNKQPAHRYSFSVFNPDIIIEGWFICHKCDRPGCVNPHHLFRGTQKDNIRDMISKGRRVQNKINYRVDEVSLESARKINGSLSSKLGASLWTLSSKD